MVALVLDSDMKTPVSIPVCTLADAKVMQADPSLFDKSLNLIWGGIANHIEGKNESFSLLMAHSIT